MLGHAARVGKLAYMEKVKLNKDKDHKYPEYMGHPIKHVPILMVYQLHVKVYYSHLNSNIKFSRQKLEIVLILLMVLLDLVLDHFN